MSKIPLPSLGVIVSAISLHWGKGMILYIGNVFLTTFWKDFPDITHLKFLKHL